MNMRNTVMQTRQSLPVLLLPALLLAGCNVNKDINIPANAHWSSGSSTINGEITVGAGAVVDGNLRTINGSISLAAGAQTGNLTTINGGISLADGAHADKLRAVNSEITLAKNAAISGDVATVNGDIRAAAGAHISGTLDNVNGDMALCNARVDRDLNFYNGTVLITDGASIQGNVTAKKPTGQVEESENTVTPTLIIGPHATVGGAISFERPGKLYVSDSAVIHDVHGVIPVKFTGETPAGVKLPTCLTE